MRYLASYGTYEMANDQQITLLAAEIDALVEFVPPGFEELRHQETRKPGYALMVEDEKFDEAVRMLSLQAEPDYKCLFSCPTCGSDNVKEIAPPLVGAMFLLFIPSVIAMTRRKTSGIPYRCLACGSRYRKTLNS